MFGSNRRSVTGQSTAMPSRSASRGYPGKGNVAARRYAGVVPRASMSPAQLDEGQQRLVRILVYAGLSEAQASALVAPGSAGDAGEHSVVTVPAEVSMFPGDESNQLVPLATEPANGRQNRAMDWQSGGWHSLTSNSHGIAPMPTQFSVKGETPLAAVAEVHAGYLLEQEIGVPVTLGEVHQARALAGSAGFTPAAEKLDQLAVWVRQHAIIDTLNVNESSRYRDTSGGRNTYCNVYAADVVRALGGYLPHSWWQPWAADALAGGARQATTKSEYEGMEAPEEAVPPYIYPTMETTFEDLEGNSKATARQLSANELWEWMEEHGALFGWRPEPDVKKAQDAASSGQIVIILAPRAEWVAYRAGESQGKYEGTSGHVSVVVAEGGGHSAHDTGDTFTPLQSQAGSTNFSYSDGERAQETIVNNGESWQQHHWWNNGAQVQGRTWIYEGDTRDDGIVRPILTYDITQ